MSEPIVILGASARAAAQSAARAGFSLWAVDLFADADLARLCPVHRIERFPCDLVAAARQAPPGAWLYTGGLENFPPVIARIAAERRLYGNSGPPLRAVRNPAMLAEISKRAGLQFPRMLSSAEALPRDGSWLRKGLRSSGGLRVQAWDEGNPAPAEVRGWYFQERIGGQSYAAVFVAAAGASRLLGISAQFVGGDSSIGDHAGAAPFHYAGSIGPLAVSPAIKSQLEKLGAALASECGIVGLFGIDFIRVDETVWPIEVNPRFPASVEVLERALNFSAIGLHVAACRDGLLPAAGWTVACDRIAGKAILYAKRALALGETAQQRLDAESRESTQATLADIPAAAGEFAVGQPIVTVLADGISDDAVTTDLNRRLDQLHRELESEQPVGRERIG